MSEFNYEVRYKPEGTNCNAEVLSQLPVNLACLEGEPGGIRDADMTEENDSITIAQSRKAQGRDEWC